MSHSLTSIDARLSSIIELRRRGEIRYADELALARDILQRWVDLQPGTMKRAKRFLTEEWV